MKGNTFAISFHLRKDRRKANNHIPLYARVSLNNKKFQLAVKFDLKEEHWNQKEQIPTNAYPFCQELKDNIFQLKNKFYSTYTELIYSEKDINIGNYKLLFFRENKKAIGLIEIMIQHNQEMENFLNKGTTYGNYKNYKTTHKFIVEFIFKIFKQKDYPLEEVNYSFIKKYEHFLQTQKSCNHNGMMKHMQRLKKVFNWAIKNEYISTNPFNSYAISFKRYDRGYLTVEEVGKIKELKGLSKKLEYTKDFFIFQLYTGLAYSDMVELKTCDISKGIDNEYWIIKQRVKTNTKITVPLMFTALEIILKYVKDISINDINKVFPKISNQKINKNLKELGALAKITKTLTTHIARHTAATTIWLQNGISIEVVSKMLGHTKITTTQIYGRIVEEKIASEMNNLRHKLK